MPIYRADTTSIDEKLVKAFLDSRVNHAKAGTTEEVLRSYSLIVEEHYKFYPTNAGILLFGKEPQFYLSEAMIICCQFKGVEGREAIASIDCIGTLLNQLLKGITYLRNPAICKVFREAGLVEKMRTGFIQIFQSYEKRGLNKPQIIEGENFVKCILPRPYQQKAPKEAEFDLLSLFYAKDELTIHDVMSEYSISRSTAQRWLQTFIAEKKIERVGKTRNIRYRRI